MFKQYIYSSIRNKLLIITGLGTALVLAASGWGTYQSWQSGNEVTQKIQLTASHELRLARIGTYFKTQIQEWNNVLLRGKEAQQREKYWNKFTNMHERIQGDVKLLAEDVGAGATREALQQFLIDHQSLHAVYVRGYQAYIDTGFDFRAGDDAVKGVDRQTLKELDTIADMLDETSGSSPAAIKLEAINLVRLNLLLVALAVVVSFVLFLFAVQRSILTPAKLLVTDLAYMASGDFTHRISVQSNDEIGQIAASAAKLQADMSTIVKSINQSVFKLSAAAEEMAHITEKSNQALMNQHNETGQVATAMNEMTATVHEVAQNTQLAAESASQASTEVGTGQKVVEESIRSIALLVQKVERAADVIHQLETNSREIGSVLDVIRSIAEQTNLLALNAAIEAARAGEQGRGFAVVADEVRVLAQRTQKSTEEIQKMIQRLQAGAQEAVVAMTQSRSQADVTRDTAAKAGQVLTSITRAVASINDMNTLIASAAEEQNTVAEEINRNIVNISTAAEATAESSTHTARASEDLRNVAEELKHTASRLKV